MTQPPARAQQRRSAPGRGLARKLSRLHRPEDMSLEAWQRALRRQFGREQKFLLKRTGGHPVFSEFEITNPQTRNTYRVVIRGPEPGNNFCSCPDFVTNTLGTCKHVEFTLARLERTPGGRTNPAVLAQRIGRVHRLGQTRPVQVVSFVAKGTIEEGMLSVLGFKRSLFAGILDGGEREVFLGGSRLKRFMESVEGVTGGIPAPVVEEAPGPGAAEPAIDEAVVDGDGEAAPAAAGTRPAVDPLSGLLRAGLELLTHVASAAGTGRATAAPESSVFERIRDAHSGQSYLKIRMPEPEVMDRVAGALEALLASLRA